MHSNSRICVSYFFSFVHVHFRAQKKKKKTNSFPLKCLHFVFLNRIFESVDGQQVIKMKDELMVLIKQMECDVLAQWSMNVTDTIHACTSQNLLMKTEKGLLATNFDQSVSIHLSLSLFPIPATCLNLVKSTEYLNSYNVIRDPLLPRRNVK